MYTERTQVLLTPAQRARLERIAAEQDLSLGAVIREAVDAYTARGGTSREAALDALQRIDAPVCEWEQMKREILRGAHR